MRLYYAIVRFPSTTNDRIFRDHHEELFLQVNEHLQA